MTDVGSARVEVTGDVRGFARQTERDLNRALSRIKSPKVEVDVDVDRDRTKKTFTQVGSEAVKALGGALSGAGSTLAPVVGAVGTALGGTLVAALIAVVVPALGAAITSAIGLGLGAGLLGLGAFALRDVKAFKDALGEVGDALNEIGKKAAKPLLKPLVEGLRGIAELVRELGPEFRQIFTALAPAIEPLTRAIGLFAGQVVRGLRDSMPGVVAAFEGLARVLPTVGRFIGDFFRSVFANSGVIDNATQALILLVSGPLKVLGPLLNGLTVIFAAWVNAVKLGAQAFVPIRDALLNFVDGGTGALARLKGAWEPLLTAIKKLWDTLVAFAAEDDTGKLAEKFAELVASIKAAWGPLKTFLGVVWDEAWAFVARLWRENVQPWIENTVMPWLKEKLKQLMEVAWEAAKQKATEKIGELIGSVTGALANLPGRIAGALAGLPGTVARPFVAAASAAMTQAGKAVSGAVSVFRTLPSKVGSALSGVRATVTGAFSGAGSWLVSAGRRIIDGLISGIQSGFDRVRGLLNSLTSMLPDWKGPAEVDRKILRDSGQLVMKGFERGLLDQRSAVRNTLQGLTGDLPTFTAGPARGSDGASAAAPRGPITVNVTINGQGREAGQEAAEAFIEALANAGS